MKTIGSEFEPGVRHLKIDTPNAQLGARMYRHNDGLGHCDCLMVFLHAGAFVAGNLNGAHGLLKALTSANDSLVVLAPEYTLASQKPFPAALEDVYSVMEWSLRHKRQLGWTGTLLIVAGIEAGANLAATSSIVARDRGAFKVNGQILLMPMLDTSLSSASMRGGAGTVGISATASTCAAAYRTYLPNVLDRMHPYASPLHSIRLNDLPPALILSLDGDPLRDEAEQYATKLIGSGIRTSVVRLPTVSINNPESRNDCASTTQVIREISVFLTGLKQNIKP